MKELDAVLQLVSPEGGDFHYQPLYRSPQSGIDYKRVVNINTLLNLSPYECHKYFVQRQYTCIK